MDTEKNTFGFGDLNPSPSSTPSSTPPDLIRRQTGWIRASDRLPEAKPKHSRRSSEPKPGGFDALQDGPPPEKGRLNDPLNPVDPEDRARAQTILDHIGRRFAENRKKGKSNAYERYQADLAENMNHLVTGGVMNLKEVSQTIMQLEEFRKQTSEHGKTPATLLAEWLRGDLPEDALK